MDPAAATNNLLGNAGSAGAVIVALVTALVYVTRRQNDQIEGLIKEHAAPNGQLTRLQADVDALKVDTGTLKTSVADLRDRTARVETRVDSVVDMLKEVQADIRVIGDRAKGPT